MVKKRINTIKDKERTIKWKNEHKDRVHELNKLSYDRLMKNPEYKEKKRLEYLKRSNERKELVYKHYGMICNCCGETEYLFLTLDHVNNDGHLHKSKSGHRKSGSTIYGEIIKQGFPDSFQILCMNCNLGKSRNKGICPHKKIC